MAISHSLGRCVSKLPDQQFWHTTAVPYFLGSYFFSSHSRIPVWARDCLLSNLTLNGNAWYLILYYLSFPLSRISTTQCEWIFQAAHICAAWVIVSSGRTMHLFVWAAFSLDSKCLFSISRTSDHAAHIKCMVHTTFPPPFEAQRPLSAAPNLLLLAILIISISIVLTIRCGFWSFLLQFFFCYPFARLQSRRHCVYTHIKSVLHKPIVTILCSNIDFLFALV